MILVVDTENNIVSLNDAAEVFSDDPAHQMRHRQGTVEDYCALIRATLPGWDGNPATVIVDEAGAPVALKRAPTAQAEIVAAERARIAGAALKQIKSSPLARAVIEGGDLSEYTTDEIVAEQGRLLRLLFAALDGAVAWPDWSRAARA
jgi:hypothetical protein